MSKYQLNSVSDVQNYDYYCSLDCGNEDHAFDEIPVPYDGTDFIGEINNIKVYLDIDPLTIDTGVYPKVTLYIGSADGNDVFTPNKLSAVFTATTDSENMTYPATMTLRIVPKN